MTDYIEMEPGQWVRVYKTNFLDACCDCGLVHRSQYRVVDGKIYMRCWRDERATAACRRRRKHKGKR